MLDSFKDLVIAPCIRPCQKGGIFPKQINQSACTLGANIDRLKTYGYNCYYKTQDEEIPVECDPGQACFAIISLQHKNSSWEIIENSLGCWDKQPYCTKDMCSVDLPNFVWVEHNFPRFCCCTGDLCNRKIKLT